MHKGSQPKLKVSEEPTMLRETIPNMPKHVYLFLLGMPRMQSSGQAISQCCTSSKQP